MDNPFKLNWLDQQEGGNAVKSLDYSANYNGARNDFCITQSYNITVKLVYEDGQVKEFPASFSYLRSDELDSLKSLGATVNGASIRFTMPAKGAKLITKATSAVQKCVFDATNKFIECNLGKKMDYEDESWFSGHPYVQQMGVPVHYIPTVIAGLVYPYGISIGHIWMRKNTSLIKELARWMELLGINPIARQDHSTSNSEFLQMFPEDSRAELGAAYNFEFVDNLPYQPLIVCCGNRTNSVTAITEGFGHAAYYSPRKPVPNSWLIALSLVGKSQVNYDLPEDMQDYDPPYMVDLYRSTIDGKPILPTITQEVRLINNSNFAKPVISEPVIGELVEDDVRASSHHYIVNLAGNTTDAVVLLGWVVKKDPHEVANDAFDSIPERIIAVDDDAFATYGDILLGGIPFKECSRAIAAGELLLSPVLIMLSSRLERFARMTPGQQLDFVKKAFDKKAGKLSADVVKAVETTLQSMQEFVTNNAMNGITALSVLAEDVEDLYTDWYPDWFVVEEFTAKP